MFDISALAPAFQPSAGGFDLDAAPKGQIHVPDDVAERFLAEMSRPLIGREFIDERGLIVDRDGLPVAEAYRWIPDRWYALAEPVRQKFSARYLDDWWRAQQKPKANEPAQSKAPAKRFTTDYAVSWGKSQGWTLIERERFDFRTKRHFDLEGKCDALFEVSSQPGRTGLQAAQPGERGAHWRKFAEWGGPEKAKQRVLKVLYVEFERGTKFPLKIEEWA